MAMYWSVWPSTLGWGLTLDYDVCLLQEVRVAALRPVDGMG